MGEESSIRLAYSIDELARLIGCGRDAVYAAIRDGRLTAKKLGRRTVVTATDAQRFIENLPDLHLRDPDCG